MKSIADAFTRVLEAVMVLCLAVMLVMVFGNVVLRLFFNTGIDLSVQMLPGLGRRICWGISQAVMLVCCVVIVYGTYLQHDIIKGNASPVAQLSMLWVFGVSYITGTAIGLICASNLLRLFAGRVRDDELIDVHEEGMADALEAEKEMAAHPLKP
jgi:TRAP-type transport system small permease protein